MTKTLYFASHDQYQRQTVRSILPVDPSWLVEALGLVHIDPTQVVEGPILRTDGKLEVRSMMPYPDGLYSRVCVIEPNAGYVTDQILYGPSGKMIAGASGSNHRYYAEQQCALPHLVHVKLIPDFGPPLELKIEVGNYTVNQLLSGDPQLFTMPQTARQQIDLATLGGSSLGGSSLGGSAENHSPSGNLGDGLPMTAQPQALVPPPPRSAYAVPQADSMLTDSYR